MIVTKMHLSRRTVLRGIGAVIGLPFLESMVPALTAQTRTAANPQLRFGAVYFPQGINIPHWLPTSTDPGFELPPIIQPLEPFRSQLVIVSGLETPNLSTHITASSMFLNGNPPKRTAGEEIGNVVTIDQLIAQKIGQDTPLPSMELGIDDMSGTIGGCEFGFSCAYFNSIAWRTPTTPLQMELNPRKAFERMFGDAESSEGRQARMEYRRSVLDMVMDSAKRMTRVVSAPDRLRLSDYLDNLREVERQIQKAEAKAASSPNATAPSGIPDDYDEHLKLMYDIAHLAWQADITRVVTFLTDHELTQRSYNHLGISEGHHSLSHHRGAPERIMLHEKIPTYHSQVFARFLGKLRETPDGDGTLLDHVAILYGSGMSDPNVHLKKELPNIVAGGACGAIKGGRHVRVDDKGPHAHANLLLALGRKAGLEIDKIGLSDGVVEL